MNKWRKFADSKAFYLILSLIVTIWIYLSVSSPRMGNTRSSSETNNVAVSNKKATINMNLQVNVDSERYFVTGYPKQVAIKIEGPAALVTATKNTQNFTIYIDLRNLSVGKHRVAIKQDGLNRDLKYTIKPRYVDLDIEPRAERTYPIQASYNAHRIAPDYQVGNVVLNPQVVQVVGARSEIQRISQIVARANLPKAANKTYQQEVLLQAVDEQGHTLSVLLTPQTANLKIPISLPTKTVPVKFVQKGDSSKTYSFSSAVQKVQIAARKEVLNQIDELELPVDVSKLGDKKSVIIKITDLNSDIIEAKPKKLKVNLKDETDQNVANNGG